MKRGAVSARQTKAFSSLLIESPDFATDGTTEVTVDGGIGIT